MFLRKNPENYVVEATVIILRYEEDFVETHPIIIKLLIKNYPNFSHF